MISPARVPNRLKSTGATSPLSSKRAEITCFGADLDRSSRSLSFSLGLLVTGTPMFPRVYFIQQSSVRVGSANHRRFRGDQSRRPFVTAVGARKKLVKFGSRRSGVREIWHHLPREQTHRCLGLGATDHAEVHLERGRFEAADTAVIAVDRAANLLRRSDPSQAFVYMRLERLARQAFDHLLIV